MTSIGLNFNYGYQTGINAGLSYSSQPSNYFMQSQSSYLSGHGDPLSALDSALDIINGPSYPQYSNYNQPQYNYNQPQNYFMGSSIQNQQYDPAVMDVMQTAMMDTMLAMGQQFALQQQIQNGYINPNDPLAMNKMMGAKLEQLGGDLKDDGIINGSNQKPNPMQMMMQFMMQMMMMFMQMMMQMLGLGQQQQYQQQPQQQYQQPYNQNDPMAANKAMGANLERIGGDLKDDGIINGSNMQKPKPNPMAMLQGMAMIFAGMDMFDNGQMDGSIFKNMMMKA